MGFLSGLFHSRDKPTNSTNGSAYRFLFGGSNSGKAVNERNAMQMTAVYQFYRSTKKDAGYKLLKTSSKNSFISTKGTKGRKYYYKARVLVYDGSKLVARSALKQCSYGARR